MNTTIAKTDFCFCTLALNHKYQLMAKELAKNLQQYAPGIKIIIGTDNPKLFQDCENVIAFEHFKTGILHCFNDKRFVISESLLYSSAAIYIDADTKILSKIPKSLKFLPGITGYSQNLLDHVKKYRPESLETFKRISSKLNISIEQAEWIGESIFVVAKDGGKEQEFLKQWDLMAKYLELKGIHSGEGNIMGLAANKIGWKVQINESLLEIDKSRKHLDASLTRGKPSRLELWKKRLDYHYRLNKARIIALMDFNFYYR